MAEGGAQMPKVDFKKDMPKLTEAQLNYMKIIENQNMERVKRLAKMKTNNKLTAASLVFSILGIYGYTIFATKQEKFLDEID